VGGEGLKTQLVAPLKSKGKVLGTITIGTHAPHPSFGQEMELIAAISSQIGVSGENARLYQQQRVIVEQLRASEERYRQLFESASDAICVNDLHGNIRAANRACEKVIGYPREEFIGLNIKELFAEESLRFAREVHGKLLSGEDIAQPYEQRMVKKDGSEAIVKLATSLVISEGKPIGFQHITRDATEEKRVQDNMILYTRQVTRAQEEERRRIARELHDETAQAVATASRQLDNFILANTGKLSRSDLTSLENLREEMDRTLEGVRRFSQGLRPSILDDLGLLAALGWLADGLSKQDGIVCKLKVVGGRKRLLPEIELVLFRVAQ